MCFRERRGFKPRSIQDQSGSWMHSSPRSHWDTKCGGEFSYICSCHVPHCVLNNRSPKRSETLCAVSTKYSHKAMWPWQEGPLPEPSALAGLGPSLLSLELPLALRPLTHPTVPSSSQPSCLQRPGLEPLISSKNRVQAPIFQLSAPRRGKCILQALK
jgi:hypothetical protein